MTSTLASLLRAARKPDLSAVRTKFGTYDVITKPASLSRNMPDIPSSVPRPPYARAPPAPVPTAKRDGEVRPAADIAKMRDACKLTAEILQMVCDDLDLRNQHRQHTNSLLTTIRQSGTLLKVGMTTEELDRLVREAIIARGAYPSPLTYHGYPKSICTSVNNIACHGIPDSRELKNGDIINVDVSVYHSNGFHGDCSQTFLVGDVDEVGRKLVDATHKSLLKAINICGHGQKLSAIGSVIESYASGLGYSVCDRFIGHGIGRDFHEGPEVHHVKNNIKGIMKTGMTFTIEPILCQGSGDIHIWSDKWTAATDDHGRSAQWEHTILITNDVSADLLNTKDSNGVY